MRSPLRGSKIRGPLVFPGYKGGDQSTPYSIKLPEIIGQDQFAAEVEVLFEEDRTIRKLIRQKDRYKHQQLKHYMGTADQVKEYSLRLIELNKEIRRLRSKANAVRARIQRFSVEKAHQWKPSHNVDTQIRKRKIQIIKEHADRQWALARIEFAKNWDKRSAAKFLKTSTINIDRGPSPEEVVASQIQPDET